MTVDRDLLWASYPEGYLAMRGVKSLGDWQCVEAEPLHSLWVHAYLQRDGRLHHGVLLTRDGSLRGRPGLRHRAVGRGVQGPNVPDGMDPRVSNYGKQGKKEQKQREFWAKTLDINEGNFLPNLDPENDPATWACALSELAQAASCPADATTLFFMHDGDDWMLGSQHVRPPFSGHEVRGYLYWKFDTDNPATALAMARAQLREAE